MRAFPIMIEPGYSLAVLRKNQICNALGIQNNQHALGAKHRRLYNYSIHGHVIFILYDGTNSRSCISICRVNPVSMAIYKVCRDIIMPGPVCIWPGLRPRHITINCKNGVGVDINIDDPTQQEYIAIGTNRFDTAIIVNRRYHFIYKCGFWSSALELLTLNRNRTYLSNMTNEVFNYDGELYYLSVEDWWLKLYRVDIGDDLRPTYVGDVAFIGRDGEPQLREVKVNIGLGDGRKHWSGLAGRKRILWSCALGCTHGSCALGCTHGGVDLHWYTSGDAPFTVNCYPFGACDIYKSEIDIHLYHTFITGSVKYPFTSGYRTLARSLTDIDIYC